MNPTKIEIGERYGRLVILSEGERHVLPSGRSQRTINCQCDCGAFKTVALNNLRNGHTQSCECLHIERIKTEKTTHGLSKHNLYKKLYQMKKRCYSPSNDHYHRYGGRGIKICDEWLKDFQTFYNWAMANGWEEGLEIDRKDNNGNYEPSNCRFITSQENKRNRKTSKLTWESVRDIRNAKLLTPEIQNKQLAVSFNVSETNISLILRNEIWREL